MFYMYSRAVLFFLKYKQILLLYLIVMFFVVRTLLYSSKSEFIKMENNFHPDAIIIGSGLAGLVAAMEITNAGKSLVAGSGN